MLFDDSGRCQENYRKELARHVWIKLDGSVLLLKSGFGTTEWTRSGCASLDATINTGSLRAVLRDRLETLIDTY